MAPEDRRAAIVDAALPVLIERGVSATTRELAEAAGVAEGTLFRVFPDKESLVLAAVHHALEPGPVVIRLRELRPPLPLPEVLDRVVRVLVERSREVGALLTVLHEVKRCQVEGGRRHERAAHLEQVIAAVTETLRPYAEQLPRPPEACARFLIGAVLGNTAPHVVERLDLEALVVLLTHGLVRY